MLEAREDGGIAGPQGVVQLVALGAVWAVQGVVVWIEREVGAAGVAETAAGTEGSQGELQWAD